jgi:hypothetical protein
MPKIEIEIEDDVYKALLKLDKKYGGHWIGRPMFGTRWGPIASHILDGNYGLLTWTIANHPSWKFPLWLREEHRVGSLGYLDPRPITGGSWGLAKNLHYASWTMVGTLDGENEAVVGLDGTITPNSGRKGGAKHSITFWLYDGGKLLAIGEDGEVTQKLISDYLPCVETAWIRRDMRVTLLCFAGSVVGKSVCFVKLILENTSVSKRKITIFSVVTPWGADRFHPLHELSYDKDSNIFIAEGEVATVFDKKPDGYTCSNYDEGDVSEDASDGELVFRTKSRCDVGYCSGAVSFNIVLEAHETKEITLKVPIDPVFPSDVAVKSIRDADFNQHLSKMTSDWEALLKQGMQIELPDKRALDLYKTTIINLHILKDGKSLTIGPTSGYHIFHVRDCSHMIRALDISGFHRSAEECLEELFKRQREDGYFRPCEMETALALGYEPFEVDTTGQAIWALVEHYRYTKDKTWLQRAYPTIKKACEWIFGVRGTTKSPDQRNTLHYGLMPKSFSAEHLGPYDYYYWDNFWIICGLREAAYAAKELGLKMDAKKFEDEYRDLENCTLHSIDQIRKKGLACFPSSPYREVESTIIGNVGGVWPCRVLDANDKRIQEVLETLYSKYMINGGFVHSAHWGAYTPLLTPAIAQGFLQRRDMPKVMEIFKWELDHATPTNAWPEAVSLRTGYGACQGDIQGWAAAEYIMLLRNMLLLEQEDSIWIAPGVPSEWLVEGSTVGVKDAPTPYGKISYKITSNLSKNLIMFELTPPPVEPARG